MRRRPRGKSDEEKVEGSQMRRRSRGKSDEEKVKGSVR